MSTPKRRSISIRGKTHAAFKAACEQQKLACSAVVESLIAQWLDQQDERYKVTGGVADGLAQAVADQGVAVVVTRQPGGSFTVREREPTAIEVDR